MKKLQIILMLLCLGIFVFPEQHFFAQQTEMSCCKSETKKDDCCKDHLPKSGNKHQSCDDGCCSSCNTCTTFVFNPVLIEEAIISSNKVVDKTSAFSYQDPFISSSLKEIWQPPKIG